MKRAMKVPLTQRNDCTGEFHMAIENKFRHMKTLIKNDFFLVFLVNNEKYACRLNTVSGILQYYNIEKISNVPELFLGAIELNKQNIPVIDMGMRIERKKSGNGSAVCVVLFIEGINETFKVGVQVDKLDEILKVSPNKIHTYSFSSGNVVDCMSGIIEVRDNEINIINTEAIFSHHELYDIKNISQQNILKN